MGKYWLSTLPQVLRAEGLVVDTYSGWETRARSTGGYDGVFAVQVHHTASSTSPASDMSYMWNGSPDRPVGAIYLARDGRVTVGAAGATNTSGKGGPRNTVHGQIPLDSANKYVISIEAANNGVGEAWPKPQIDAYIKVCAALQRAYGLSVGDTHAHHEWTSRKVDPAGNSKYASGGNKWNMDTFRGDVWLYDQEPEVPHVPPVPTPGGPDVFQPIYPIRNSDTRGFGGAGLKAGVPSEFGLNPDIFPANTNAVAFNVTVIPSTNNGGFFTVWPNGTVKPNSSCVNFEPNTNGQPANGAIVVGINDRSWMMQLHGSSAHVIFDATGYWTT